MRRFVYMYKTRLLLVLGVVVLGVAFFHSFRSPILPVMYSEPRGDSSSSTKRLEDRIRSLETMIGDLVQRLDKSSVVKKCDEGEDAAKKKRETEEEKRKQEEIAKKKEEEKTKQEEIAKKKREEEEKSKQEKAKSALTQAPFSAKDVRITWESGDEMNVFVSRLCEHGFKKVPNITVRCKADDYEGNVMFFNHYRPHKFTLQVPVRQQVHFHMENHITCNHQATILWTARTPVNASCPTIIFCSYGFVRFSFPMPNFQNVSVLLRDAATFPAKEILASKKHFCAMACRDCDYDKYIGLHGLNDTFKGHPLVRTQVFDYLSKNYKKVHGLSGCRKNFEPVPTPGVPVLEETIMWFRPYKFAIVMENSPGRGHITEKIFNAYNAKTVPIYWGPTDLEEYFNLDALIWCKPDVPGHFNLTFAKCLEEVRAVDSSDELYMKKLSAPLLKGNVIPPWLTFEHIAEQVVKVWDNSGLLKL